MGVRQATGGSPSQSRPLVDEHHSFQRTESVEKVITLCIPAHETVTVTVLLQGESQLSRSTVQTLHADSGETFEQVAAQAGV